MSTAGNLIGMLFAIRDQAHLAHLSTNSYAQHMALGDFYDAIVDLVDSFAEVYQGMYGIIKDTPRLDFSTDLPIETRILNSAEWIEINRVNFSDNKMKPIQNILDEILAEMYRTLYKLNNLK